jgi:hypothetical protein
MLRWPFTHCGRKAISYGCDGYTLCLCIVGEV